jgi:hypothetical protein
MVLSVKKIVKNVISTWGGGDLIMFLVMGQLNDEILQRFINKHIIVDLENVQRSKKKEKLQDVKLAQTRCQNLSKQCLETTA